MLLAGCAAASSAPGLLNVRQVVLLRQPLSGAFTSEAQMLAAFASGATTRFSAQHPEGYISVIFGNPDAHRIQFTVRRDGGDALYTSDSAIGAHPSYSIARGFSGAFPIRGTLTPGRYALDLTIDAAPAGSYAFIVE